MFQLSTMRLSRKLFLIIGSALAGIVVLSLVFLVSERRLILGERQISVRQTVEVAHGIVAQAYEEVKAGKWSEAEGQQRALAALRGLRYSKEEYFWVNDMQPRMLMHPIKPAMQGQDLSGVKDPNGQALFLTINQVVKDKGEGFVDYQWTKPGSDHPVDKISFVKGFTPWGWVIGSGLYVDDVNAAVLARAAYMMGGALLIGGLLTALGWAIARLIVRQIGCEPAEAVALTQRLASGDLRVQIALQPGDHDSLLHAIGTMRDGIAHIVNQVRDGSESVATASTQIATGNLDLSQRTERQAAALQETAASMAQLSDAVRHNADGAHSAKTLAQTAAGVAVSGGEMVNQVVSTMHGIQDSSRRIADIIGVIDGIAFQTNILALNAAVEAARAGEQGRGFAVVAGEVRSLAQRSAKAAQEIKHLITDSVERVSQGSELVTQAGSTMSEVVQSIQRVSEIVSEISTATGEQSQGVGQISLAINQMDQATQQNAALVEESAAAAESLKQQSRQLVGAVSTFQTHG